MSRVLSLRAAAVSVVCIALAACGDSTAPTPAAVDVDTLLAEANVGQAALSVGFAFGGGIAPSTAPLRSASCSYVSSTQSFVCPTVTLRGLTINTSYQFLDASGVAQSAFSPTTTAAIRTVQDVSGTIEAMTGTTTSTTAITSHRDHTLSGLLTGTHVLNGTGTSTSTVSFNGTTFKFTIDETTTNLVLPKRGSGSPYPTSGSIAMVISADGMSTKVTITFDGTSTVTIVTTEDGFTETCKLDLSKAGSAPVCH